MGEIKPDILAKVHFFKTDEGGLKKPIWGERIGCLMSYEGEKFDCYLLLEKTGIIKPGQEANVPISFLFPEYVENRMKKGDKFFLWFMRNFAEGEVISIPFNES